MGSKLTRIEFTDALDNGGSEKTKACFFLDSKTTGKSVAWQQAENAGISRVKERYILRS